MPRGGAHFTAKELEEVLGYYDIGKIKETRPLNAGNRNAPKMIVESERGKFMLKRRPSGKDDLYRVAFSHSVLMQLAEKGFPVSALITTKQDDNTILQMDRHIYELFHFVSGERYDGSDQSTIDAGKQMAKFHKYLRNFNYDLLKPLKGSFHDSSNVREHIKTIGSKKRAPRGALKHESNELMRLYETSSVRVNALGFDKWRQQIVHGDWHPGNMLFSDGKIAALVDFDSVKIAPAVTDFANGMLQFSIVGGRPNPVEWPDYLDENKLMKFLYGYREVISLNDCELGALPDLMIETMIAEAVLPVAATGFFGNLHGEGFLKMICRKVMWIEKNHIELVRAILRA
ncbi:MAG: phosphotransferase [Sedimentisphaerales bacterium]|nr:phosphotransferase [Sedimentisphaerales bacterium]